MTPDAKKPSRMNGPAAAPTASAASIASLASLASIASAMITLSKPDEAQELNGAITSPGPINGVNGVGQAAESKPVRAAARQEEKLPKDALIGFSKGQPPLPAQSAAPLASSTVSTALTSLEASERLPLELPSWDGWSERDGWAMIEGVNAEPAMNEPKAPSMPLAALDKMGPGQHPQAGKIFALTPVKPEKSAKTTKVNKIDKVSGVNEMTKNSEIETDSLSENTSLDHSTDDDDDGGDNSLETAGRPDAAFYGDPGMQPGQLAEAWTGDDPGLDKRIEDFWVWISANETRIAAVELDARGHVCDKDMETILLLAEACAKIHSDLSIELVSTGGELRLSGNDDGVGTVDEDGPWVDMTGLTISANGIADVFMVVEKVVDQAPKLDWLKVIKYRQRQEKINPLSLKGHTLIPKHVKFAISRHKATGQFGIYVFIKGYTQADSQVWKHLGFIFLDMALGEFDVATKVTNVEFYPFNALPNVHRLTIVELPVVFDYMFNKSRH